MGPRTAILKAAVRETAAHDLGPLRPAVASVAWTIQQALLRSGSELRRAAAFRMMLRLHSGALSEDVDRRIADSLRTVLKRERAGERTGLSLLFEQVIQREVDLFRKSNKPDPKRILAAHALVVKSATQDERGVLVIDYSNHFPLMAGLFRLKKIAERYTIVLEPSWAGVSAPEIMLYTQLPHTVFVETTEPRDRDFLSSLDTNLTTAPVAANWWTNPREPLHLDRDIDIAMIAAWADIKRHWRVFRALAQLRKRGHRLRTVLVGYRYDRTMSDIRSLAAHYGIEDQIETHEYISQDEVWKILSRSKLHVLWSRRECANRAIIEAMLADVPVIVREGLTFGFKYPYINDRTGRFVREADLPNAILEMVQNYRSFSPREWVLGNMTYAKANTILEEMLSRDAQRRGAPWTRGLTPKISGLYGQQYANPDDERLFRDDYAFLESLMTPSV